MNYFISAPASISLQMDLTCDIVRYCSSFPCSSQTLRISGEWIVIFTESSQKILEIFIFIYYTQNEKQARGVTMQFQQIFDGVTVVCLNFWPVFVAGAALLINEIREDMLRKDRYRTLKGITC